MVQVTSQAALQGIERRFLELQRQTPQNPAGTREALTALLQELRREHHAPVLEARILCGLGGCTFYQRDFESTLHYNEEALECLREQTDPNIEGAVRNAIALAKQNLGLNDEALEEFLISLRLCEEAGLIERRAQTLINIALCHHRLGNQAEALELQLEALAFAKQHDYQLAVAYSQAYLIAIYAALERFTDALALGNDTLHRLAELGDTSGQLEVRRDLSAAHLGLGQVDLALEQAQAGLDLEIAKSDAYAMQRGELHVALARALMACGEDSSAEEQLHEASGLLHDRVNASLHLHVQQELTHLYERRGDFRMAFRHSQRQAEIERQMGAALFENRSASLRAHARVRALQREAEAERQRNEVLAKSNHELRELQASLTYQATHDALTGLANRAHFRQTTNQALLENSGGRGVGVLFIDLDQFKAVNDLYGHAVGDALLREVAARLTGAVPAPGLVGRVGGDEFNVLLPALDSRDALLHEARRLLELLRQPYYLGGRFIEVTSSIGCALSPEDGHDAETLQRHADLAMFSVKHTTQNEALLFNPQIKRDYERRLSLTRALRGAVERGELQLVYQGRFEMQSQCLAGFEVLVRWQHPEFGEISPVVFIPLAEESGHILPIGAWVLREACQQAVRWDFAERGLSMAVNVSAIQFEQDDFAEKLREALAESGLPGHALILELTETVVLRDMSRAKAQIHQLQQMGVRIAMDDFGTGYSSLSVLHELPFDHLKIDRSFIAGIQDQHSRYQHSQDQQQPQETSTILIESMVNLSHKLRIKVTAEGVESLHQMEFLKALGCDYVQGYQLGQPLAAQEAEGLLGSACPRPPISGG